MLTKQTDIVRPPVPEWKNFNLSEIKDIEILENSFLPHADYDAEGSKYQIEYKIKGI